MGQSQMEIFFSETKHQLGRELAECEVNFLQWMYERHELEKTERLTDKTD
ncbi:hypothetical protein QR721_11485 [Aciduricibacillus chroicocephali]|uniref:Fur-regulated basic protein FbpA n=1 Tax=Aciduricibacillus chroicocephali TaxID=3054939 RepID=A0ABY9KTV1_9BACI|nr:hypothetical protein QR721_11485 [Bacillaceae bacterium 44XB]